MPGLLSSPALRFLLVRNFVLAIVYAFRPDRIPCPRMDWRDTWVAEMNLVAMQNKNAITHIFAKMKSLITWIRLVGEDEETMTKSRFKKMRTNHDEASYVSSILPATGKSLPSGRKSKTSNQERLGAIFGKT